MLYRFDSTGLIWLYRGVDRRVILKRLDKFVKYDLFTKMNYFKDAGLDVWFKCSTKEERVKIHSDLFDGIRKGEI